jgi:predicted phage tail protein
MKVIKVYGELKKRIGQSRLDLDVATPAEAIRALCANFSGLQKWIVDSEKDGVAYRVKVGKEQIGEDNLEVLHYPWSEREVFSITPVLMGAGKGGWGKVLIGGLMIGAAVLTGGTSLAFTGTGFAVASGATATGMGLVGLKALALVGTLGISVGLMGISELLSPTPDVPEEAETLANYAFSGVANITRVGTPVPIAYGRLFVGSSVISSGLDVDQVV